MSSRTLILGGGFGGISAALELKQLLGDDHEVVLIDRNPDFLMGLRKLWALVGLGTMAEGSRPRALLSERGIIVVQEMITEIHASSRGAQTPIGRIDGDHLVIALGAVSRPDLVPGLADFGHDVWGFAGIPTASDALDRFRGGRLLVLVAGAPYPCPPAPYECAIHLDRFLHERGIRDATDLAVVTLQPMLMPNAGRAGSDWMAGELAGRGISTRVGSKAETVEPGWVIFPEGEERFDLLIAVPPHRPPIVVEESGLLSEHGWIGVDPHTLATRYPGVYAIGDVNLIPLANGMPLPKAGVMAEAQGIRVARSIATELRGEEQPPPFDGRGFCPVEVGEDAAAFVRGDWYAEPEPVVQVDGPSEAYAAEKRNFETERLERWFGG